MAETVLMRFLRSALIDMNGDDAKFEKIEATSGEVAKRLIKTPSKIAPFALTAFDSEVRDDQPAVAEVIEILSDKWPMHYNTIGGSPVAVVRAVIAAALEEAARKSVPIAAAVVALGRNVLPHTPAGPERQLWSSLFIDLELRVEAAAQEAWKTPDQISVKPTNLATGPVEVPVNYWKLDRDKLKLAFEAAAGPHDAEGTAGANPNPHWPGTNQHWVTGFGSRAAKAVADAVDPALRIKIGPIDLAAAMAPVSEGFTSQMNEALSAVAGATAGLQRRSALLWWKEALYSPSLRRSYRELSLEEAAAAMAFDVHMACSPLTPVSVSYFLQEAVRKLPGAVDAPGRSLIDISALLSKTEAAEPLREATVAFGLSDRRAPFLSLLVDQGGGSVTDDSFRDRTGVPAETSLRPDELALWLFRELQACRLTSTTEGGRKSRRTSS